MPGGHIDLKGRLTKNLDTSRDLTPKFDSLDILDARFGRDKIERRKKQTKKKVEKTLKVPKSKLAPFRTREEREKYKAEQLSKLESRWPKRSRRKKKKKKNKLGGKTTASKL